MNPSPRVYTELTYATNQSWDRLQGSIPHSPSPLRSGLQSEPYASQQMLQNELFEKMKDKIAGNVKIARSKFFQRQERRMQPVSASTLDSCILPIQESKCL